MTEHQALVADLADGLLDRLGPDATVAQSWSEVEASGLTGLTTPEDAGGFGGSWSDARRVFRLVGYHATPLPVVEAMIAAALAPSGTQGLGTVAAQGGEGLKGDRFTGRLAQVPWGRDADFVIAQAADRTILLGRPDAVEPGENLAGEPRDGLIYRNAAVTPLALVDLLALCAAARVAQIAGALDATLGRSVEYVNARQQFGRSLAKFQAVQHALAGFAVEAAAVNCAAAGVFEALDRGDAAYEVAAAKLRANMAVGVGTSVAHQVHGAIGFTRDYGLHPFTRRLWSWRSEYGADRYWADRLGGQVSARGAEAFWPDLTARLDPVEA